LDLKASALGGPDRIFICQLLERSSLEYYWAVRAGRSSSNTRIVGRLMLI
jgi:hypothetical protein